MAGRLLRIHRHRRDSALAEDMTGRELFDETIPIGGPWDIFLKGGRYRRDISSRKD